MAFKKAYILSLAAERDLEEIFNYTANEFGLAQAGKYLLEIEALLVELAKQPFIGRSRNELKRGLRSFSKSSHIIFYRVMKDYIRVIRVLHARRDLPRFFD